MPVCVDFLSGRGVVNIFPFLIFGQVLIALLQKTCAKLLTSPFELSPIYVGDIHCSIQ